MNSTFFLFFTRPFSGKLNYLKHSPLVLAPVHFQIELAWSRLPPPCFAPTPIRRAPAALIKPQMCLTKFSSGGYVLCMAAGGGRFTLYILRPPATVSRQFIEPQLVSINLG